MIYFSEENTGLMLSDEAESHPAIDLCKEDKQNFRVMTYPSTRNLRGSGGFGVSVAEGRGAGLSLA